MVDDLHEWLLFYCDGDFAFQVLNSFESSANCKVLMWYLHKWQVMGCKRCSWQLEKLAVKLAQLVKRSFMVQEVAGSIPSCATLFAHMKN